MVATQEITQQSIFEQPAVFNLPDDILYYIIKIVMGLIEHDNQRRKIPFRAGLVCRRWRELTVGSALLWTQIHFQSHEEGHPLQSLLLERSKASPLSITIVNKDHDTAMHDISAIIELIRPHFSRFKSLKINSASHQALRMMIDEFRASPAPLLEEFALVGPSSADVWELEPLDGSCWHLSKLILCCGKVNMGGTLVRNLRWLELGASVGEDVVYTNLTTSHILTILSTAPLLETFILWLGSVQLMPGQPWRGPQLSLQYLQTLEVHSSQHPVPFVTDLLGNIVAPAICSMKSMRPFPQEYMGPLIKLPHFPLPGLRNLAIAPRRSQVPAYYPTVAEFLKCLPQLQRLEVTHFVLADRVISSLSTSCPQLDQMRVYYSEKPKLVQNLQTLISARRQSLELSPVRLLELCRRPSLFPSPEDWLTEEEQACLAAEVETFIHGSGIFKA